MQDRRDSAQYASDGTALLLTAAAAAALLATGRTLLDNVMPRTTRSDSGIELTVQVAPVEAPPVPPRPPPPVPPRVKAHRTQPEPTPPADSLPVDELPAPADTAAVLAYSPPPAPAPALAQTRPDLEAQYAAELKVDIERRHRPPPDSALYRLRHPSGEVRVAFVVLRGGEPQSVSVLKSSGSAILDEAAVKLVSAGHYPPMPEKVFVGETRHSFVISVEYRPAL